MRVLPLASLVVHTPLVPVRSHTSHMVLGRAAIWVAEVVRASGFAIASPATSGGYPLLRAIGKRSRGRLAAVDTAGPPDPLGGTTRSSGLAPPLAIQRPRAAASSSPAPPELRAAPAPFAPPAITPQAADPGSSDEPTSCAAAPRSDMTLIRNVKKADTRRAWELASTEEGRAALLEKFDRDVHTARGHGVRSAQLQTWESIHGLWFPHLPVLPLTWEKIRGVGPP